MLTETGGGGGEEGADKIPKVFEEINPKSELIPVAYILLRDALTQCHGALSVRLLLSSVPPASG